MKGIIDRFEGKYAVVELEDGKMINIDKAQLPIGSRRRNGYTYIRKYNY